MSDASRTNDRRSEVIRIPLGSHDLEDDAAELCATVDALVRSGPRSDIALDTTDTEGVTLEAAGALVRLHTRLRRAGVDLRIDPLHPRVHDKLASMGVLRMLAPFPRG
jgi:hypothetical protein